MLIEVKEITIPAHWHTASDCRQRAESWENEELRSCIEKTLAGLWDIAGQGGTSGAHPIRTGRPIHFYETFQKMMETLGFKVEAPADPANTYNDHKYWTFRW